jgi:hypothetical protein
MRAIFKQTLQCPTTTEAAASPIRSTHGYLFINQYNKEHIESPSLIDESPCHPRPGQGLGTAMLAGNTLKIMH